MSHPHLARARLRPRPSALPFSAAWRVSRGAGRAHTHTIATLASVGSDAAHRVSGWTRMRRRCLGPSACYPAVSVLVVPSGRTSGCTSSRERDGAACAAVRHRQGQHALRTGVGPCATLDGGRRTRGARWRTEGGSSVELWVHARRNSAATLGLAGMSDRGTRRAFFSSPRQVLASGRRQARPCPSSTRWIAHHADDANRNRARTAGQMNGGERGCGGLSLDGRPQSRVAGGERGSARRLRATLL